MNNINHIDAKSKPESLAGFVALAERAIAVLKSWLFNYLHLLCVFFRFFNALNKHHKHRLKNITSGCTSVTWPCCIAWCLLYNGLQESLKVAGTLLLSLVRPVASQNVIH